MNSGRFEEKINKFARQKNIDLSYFKRIILEYFVSRKTMKIGEKSINGALKYAKKQVSLKLIVYKVMLFLNTLFL